MNRIGWKLLLLGTVASFGLLIETSQAQAQCCGRYRPIAWSYYAPIHTSYCCGAWGSPYVSSGDLYLGYRRGPVRRLLFGPHRWYWGPSGWCCGGCYSSCCGETYTSCCGDTGTSTDAPAPGAQPPQTPTPAKKPAIDPPNLPTPAEPQPPKTSSNAAETKGTITLVVPSGAKVTVNGHETRSTGERRQFVSYGLKPGFSYKYTIHAEIVRDGQVQEDNRTVVLTAGQVTAVAMDLNSTNASGLAMAQ